MYNLTFIGNIRHWFGCLFVLMIHRQQTTLDLRNQSLSICMTEIMSIVQSWKEGGEDDF